VVFVSLTDSHHRFHTLRSVFVFFGVFTFRFSSINKEISLSSRSLLVSRDSFSLKPQNFVSIHCFLREKTSVSAIFFIVHLVSLMPDVTFVENLSNGLLEYKYRGIFVLVLGVICTLLNAVE